MNCTGRFFALAWRRSRSSVGRRRLKAQIPHPPLPWGLSMTLPMSMPPSDVDAFIASFLGTFGGKSTKHVIARVTPTPSKTTSQFLQIPVAAVRTDRDFTERTTLVV